MILVDTSIWVDHLKRTDSRLGALLEARLVLMHPFVFGELAMGDLRPRGAVLHTLSRLPEMLPARNSEVLSLVDRSNLYATGIGYIDAHLLASVLLRPGARILTRDQKLRTVAERLGIAVRSDDA